MGTSSRRKASSQHSTLLVGTIEAYYLIRRHGLRKTPAVALCGPVAFELVVTGRADRPRCGKIVR